MTKRFLVGEKITREIFEQIFGYNFIKTRPEWLLGLELDGFCKELNLAFEYQGLQHYEPIKFYGISKFEKQKINDKKKKFLCELNNVKLIIIPQYNKTNNINKCIETVEYILTKNNICIPNWSKFIDEEKINKPLINVFGSSRIKLLEDILLIKNGKLLSSSCFKTTDLLLWKCKYGHEWKARIQDIENKHWCPDCAGLRKKTISDMHAIAKIKNGKFLSEKYINATTKYIWECNRGHQWEANYGNVKTGRWCPKCCDRRNKKYL